MMNPEKPVLITKNGLDNRVGHVVELVSEQLLIEL